MSTVPIPGARLERWVANFRGRHGETGLQIVDGALAGAAHDGSTFTARLPFEQRYAGLPDPAAFAAAITAPDDWGVLLVRKGGFAVARLHSDRMVDSKVGRRHVQGRTKAGGQSQQRFARRRDNQARQAFEAAAEHAARILAGLEGPVVCGGDRSAIEAVLSDPRLTGLKVMEPWLHTPEPNRAVLEKAIDMAAAARVDVTNAEA